MSQKAFLLSSLPLMAAGVLGSAIPADAALIQSGDNFNFSGNTYASLNQFDFVGPPPIGDPQPQTLNQNGFFTIISATGGFIDGVFDPPQVPNPAGEIKDIRQTGTPGSITQEANPANGTSQGKLVTDFITFNNGSDLNFTITLDRVRLLEAGNPPTEADPDTPLGALVVSVTGTLFDFEQNKEFDLVGSFTPNIGAGSAFEGVTFGDFQPGDNFIGSPDPSLNPSGIASGEGPLPYTASFRVVEREVEIPEPATLFGLFSVGTLAATTLKRKQRA
ncbi:MAG: PEP-CTERM sorting domain-containing protein [Hydrococcus sp. Prado102]|jgi:hypothetical protein|nr:PEP-CTERM sorting domain-containing protein [Hydrococcus sp. Prado102]